MARVKRKKRVKGAGGGACEIISAHGRKLAVCKTKNPKTGKDFFYVKFPKE